METLFKTNSCFFTLTVTFSIAVLVIAKSDDDTYFTTKLGKRIPKNIIRSALTDVEESDWKNHIYELVGSGKETKLIGSSFSHEFSNARFETHLLRDSILQKTPPVFVDNKQMPAINFSYTTLTTPTARVLNDVNGSAFAVFREDKLLHPIDNKNKVRLFMSSPTTLKKYPKSNGTGNHNEDVIDNEKEEDLEPTIPTVNRNLPKGGGCLPSDSPAVLEIAITFDSTLCRKFSGDATKVVAFLTDSVNQGMIPFHYQTCIRHSIVHYSGYCDPKTDPYQAFLKSDSYSSMIDGIRRLWGSPGYKYSRVHRDITYWFTYDRSPGGHSGVAFNGAACNPVYGYAWTSSKAHISTISHELGHAFSAVHDRTSEDGIMNTKRDRYTQKKFSVTSLKKIREFVLKSGSCLFDSTITNPYVVIRDHDYTCETGFDKKLRPTESAWFLQVEFTPEKKIIIHPFYVYFKQAPKEFQLTLYVKDKNYRIKTYYRMVSLTEITNSRQLGQSVDLPWKYMTTIVWSSWTWAEVNRPPAVPTCCGHKVYIYFVVLLCRKDSKDCSWKSAKFTQPRLYCS